MLQKSSLAILTLAILGTYLLSAADQPAVRFTEDLIADKYAYTFGVAGCHWRSLWAASFDRGREDPLSWVSPPSEPDGRFSRIRLSG